MKASEMIKNLKLMVIEYGDLELIYSIDDEGNGYSKIYSKPSVGYYDEGEYIDIEQNEEEGYIDLYKLNLLLYKSIKYINKEVIKMNDLEKFGDLEKEKMSPEECLAEARKNFDAFVELILEYKEIHKGHVMSPYVEKIILFSEAMAYNFEKYDYTKKQKINGILELSKQGKHINRKKRIKIDKDKGE